MIQQPVGASAQSIWAHLVEGAGPQHGDYPSDAGDFDRCESFLIANPELRADFERMAGVNAYWAALVPQWNALRLMVKEDVNAELKAILAPIQKADPHHVSLGGGASMRLGPNAFKNTPREEPVMSGPGHNSSNAYSVTADELRQFIERYEQLEAEKKDVTEGQKELMAEAKGRGYDTKVMRKVIALRKRKPDDIAEEEAVLELYKSALGMA
jgi:uncharacterized protein (UPF0335 family)